MKVKIGPYTNWFGPYQLAEVLCFWAKPEVDEYGISSKPTWVHKFGEWLAHGSIESEPKVGELRLFDRERPTTLLYKFLLWVDSKKKRKVSVTIDSWDTVDAQHTLALIILPMLKAIKEHKHSTPFVDDEDAPDNLSSANAAPKEHDWEWDSNAEKRWAYVLDEMIYAFEHVVDTDWEFDGYKSPKMGLIKQENGMFRMVSEETEETKQANEALHKRNKAIHARIANGLTLFGKYYQTLWS